MIQSRGADVNQRDNLVADDLLGGILIRGGMQARQFGRDLDAQILCERYANHDVARVDLVTQTDGFDFAVTINRVADADHRIGEVDEPCLGTGLLHVTRDLENRPNVTRRVRKSAGAAVLGVGLPYTMFERNFKIPLPKIFARADFNGVDNELRAIQRLAIIGVGGDGHLRIPLAIQSFSETMIDFKRIGIDVHERHFASTQALAPNETGESIFGELGASCTDDGDGGGEGHAAILIEDLALGLDIIIP